MAKITDLKFAYQAFMRAYPYRKVDWHPGARLEKPLSGAKVAVVTTAAFFRPDRHPFDTTIRGGDYSYRVIPSDTVLSTLLRNQVFALQEQPLVYQTCDVRPRGVPICYLASPINIVPALHDG
jgi:hypothetical protein